MRDEVRNSKMVMVGVDTSSPQSDLQHKSVPRVSGCLGCSAFIK